MQCGTEQCGALSKQGMLDPLSVQRLYLILKFHPGTESRLSFTLLGMHLGQSLTEQRAHRKVPFKADVLFLEEFPAFFPSEQLV